MIATVTEPIEQHWTTDGARFADEDPVTTTATAAQVNERLARIEVPAVGTHLVPYLAAAAAELALLMKIAWPFSADDPPVALLRLIARAAARRPHAGGPHTARLYDILD